MSITLNRIFYFLKPLIPRKLQLFLRRQIVLHKRKRNRHIWPIDPNARNPPSGWSGWPGKKQFALVITHDVDTQKGHDRCYQLMDLDEKLGFKSSFNFVPERYEVSDALRNEIPERGFEVGIHGLKHDGKLYSSKHIFKDRALKINNYIKKWDVVGFRSPSMHHNLNWLHELDIQYDASTFDTDPFEPQSDGVGTIFPFLVKANSSRGGYMELPYTLPQDFALFVLMKERSIEIWKKKLRWIIKNGGLALLNVHPDYVSFNGENLGIQEYPVKYYADFLKYIRLEYEGSYWHALPKEIARFCMN